MEKKLIPVGMNIELTTACPLRCPQCYCSLEGGKNIPLELAVRRLKEGSEIGVEHVELSGGETLCYPFLLDVIKVANGLNIKSNIAISGWNFTREYLSALIKAGVGGIYVSLNAPNKELNLLTRDGFEYAIESLKILNDSDFDEYYINWVMHKENAGTLNEMILLAEKYNVKGIAIIAPKPTAQHELNSFPTMEQIKVAANIIKTYKGPVFVYPETCFSQLLAFIGENKFWGNLNRGVDKGCGAGITTFSVNVDGALSPCRHMDYFENNISVYEYWYNSRFLKELRELDKVMYEPCDSCKFKNYCRPCMAVNSKLEGKLYRGTKYCPIGNQ